MLKFRLSFRIAAAVLLALFLWMGVAAALSPEPDHITLTWAGDPRTTQTITWRTDTSVSFGQIRFHEIGKEASTMPHPSMWAASTKRMETPVGTMNVHSATLTALTPGERYLYQVGSGETWSDVHSFRTEPLKAGSFKFLIFGDSQSLDYGVWRTTLQKAYRANPDAVFFTNMGDLVDVGQNYAEWEAWFAASQGVAENLQIMPLTGNHESYTPEGRFSQPEFFTAQFILPDNGPEGLKRQVYSFDFGDVHFVMLDSQEGEQRKFVPDMLDRQRQWLASDLAASQKKWKVAFIHRPLYGNKPGGVNERLRQAFAPVFDQYNVDLVFTAHDHVYARTLPYNSGEAATPPGRGTIYVSTGRSGTKTYADVSAKEWNSFFHNPVAEPNYLTVMINATTIRVTAFTQNGELIDEWAIDKVSEKPES